jgi:hypothetical protein
MGARTHLSRRQSARVAALLADEFGHDAATAELVRTRLVRGVERGHRAAFEVILDDPGSARFRLRWGPDGPRVAFYPTVDGPRPTPGDLRAAELTTSIRQLTRSWLQMRPSR